MAFDAIDSRRLEPRIPVVEDELRSERLGDLPPGDRTRERRRGRQHDVEAPARDRPCGHGNPPRGRIGELEAVEEALTYPAQERCPRRG
jgi:hypothetical protein